jgi:hypothetical protein
VWFTKSKQPAVRDNPPPPKRPPAPSLTTQATKGIRVRFALIMLILGLLSAAAEARYMLEAKGRWVKCVPL